MCGKAKCVELRPDDMALFRNIALSQNSIIMLLLFTLAVLASVKGSHPLDSNRIADANLENYMLWLQFPDPIPVHLQVEDALPPSDDHPPQLAPSIGVFASRDIQTGEPLFTIPNRFFVSRSDLIADAGDSEYDPPCGHSHGIDADHIDIAAWILREKSKGDQSLWAPQLSLFPSHVPSPFLFHPSLIKEIEESRIVTEILDRSIAVANTYPTCRADRIANASLAEFKWALSISWSRSLTVLRPETESGQESILLPMAEYFNHDNRYQATWEVVDDGITFVAASDVREGEQIFISYGAQSTAGHFISHGFVPASNEFDSVALFADIPDIIEAFAKSNSIDFLSRLDYDWMDYAATQAVNKVESIIVKEGEQQEQEEDSGFGMEFSHSEGFSVFSHGRIEPRMVAALAAVWYYNTYHTEPNYDVLAGWSIDFGRNVGGVTCASLEQETYDVNQAVQGALGFVYGTVQQVVDGYSTSLEEDSAVLSSLLECSTSQCKAVSETELISTKAVLVFRMERKRLLLAVLTRLQQTCSGDEAEAAVGSSQDYAELVEEQEQEQEAEEEEEEEEDRDEL